MMDPPFDLYFLSFRFPCYFLSIRLVVLHLILALHPFGPGDVPAHRLIRAGVIPLAEALRDFAWQMQRKHATMQPAEHQSGSATLPSSAIRVQPTRALDTVGCQLLTRSEERRVGKEWRSRWSA